MRDILTLVPKPSHFAGSEWGAVRKPQASARVALAFPDLYEVGMSYLGQAILYEAVNRRPELAAERVYAPSREAAEVLRHKGAPLCTLETDTPLADCDMLAFHLTHELCYTNVLFMLDLAGLPLLSSQRDAAMPLVAAGGGCAFNPEPLAPFIDIAVLGDGEDILPDILLAVRDSRARGEDRRTLLLSLSRLPGVYVPSFFEPAPGGGVRPLVPGYDHVEKALVPDLDAAVFPANRPVSFGQAVHDRLAVEIARGCTRGCRFCHAGMIYRPVRERSLATIASLVDAGLAATGFEELSFLSLSTGDFSALESLFCQFAAKCRREQVAISLPSLRAGTLSDSMLAIMAGIRRTGATVAPEAATQRLRDVINKGISEQDILSHAGRLFARGWQQVKLYFMIGLPTETRADVQGIFELCHRVLALAPPGTKRLQVTAAVSPFVPKPHTPFQWERQDSREETAEKLAFLRSLFSTNKKLTMRWHDPAMSRLEGVFSRGDRNLAPAVLRAYRAGALFCDWADHFKPSLWDDAFAAEGIDSDAYLAARDPDAPLPWDHLHTGVSTAFLKLERRRSRQGHVTPDCRFGDCSGCGVCSFEGRRCGLPSQAHLDIRPRLNRESLELPAVPQPDTPSEDDLTRKAGHYRVWYAKLGPAAFLSQLELQSVFERSLRRAGVAPTFSAGFHPLPLLSFGWALPVGVESRAEWFAVFLRTPLSPDAFARLLAPALPEGLILSHVEELPMGRKVSQPEAEEFFLRIREPHAQAALDAIRAFAAQAHFPFLRVTKKGTKSEDIRPILETIEPLSPDTVRLVFSWREKYISPLKLVRAVCPDTPPEAIGLVKTQQIFGGLRPPNPPAGG
ncbi:TIGR03960 family B12-binding radical SAM protein [Desulfolutivibrio sulfoxidireducens]|uniref:TIGR03960 family B12-binding radical SAM protein n=1 Tax=Desulfolutivibrio sulfoxidireducens TaxID=2773299 RepID=UPI00159DB45E|nr:TIGR03960 family B12-binding radical SAM protein [Desulfolutivibrio sulfoxidireducens]QLA20611.1 TIGR03960 family B12-binding radical SAM protein [Desulfolutivibrio sulfoxidireducens]